jgi:hypothetical protein
MRLLVTGVVGLVVTAAWIINRRMGHWDESARYDPSDPPEHDPKPGEPAYHDHLYRRFGSIGKDTTDVG